MEVIILVTNAATGLVCVCSVLSILFQIRRRQRRKQAGETISPMRLIIRMLLKYWLYTALIVIPLASAVSWLALTTAGVTGAEIAVALFTQTMIGNIGTTLLLGYLFMRADKDVWSDSAIEVREIRRKDWPSARFHRRYAELRDPLRHRHYSD
jgi:polyferredoxin